MLDWEWKAESDTRTVVGRYVCVKQGKRWTIWRSGSGRKVGSARTREAAVAKAKKLGG